MIVSFLLIKWLSIFSYRFKEPDSSFSSYLKYIWIILIILLSMLVGCLLALLCIKKDKPHNENTVNSPAKEGKIEEIEQVERQPGKTSYFFVYIFSLSVNAPCFRICWNKSSQCWTSSPCWQWRVFWHWSKGISYFFFLARFIFIVFQSNDGATTNREQGTLVWSF